MREGICGPQYGVKKFFLDSGRAEARRVVLKLGYRKNMNVVEIGSGAGRFAIGLLGEVGEVDYWGFDPVAPWIDWCRKYIEEVHPSFHFIHIDVKNENYSPDGVAAGEKFKFPMQDGHADIVYMWGVFTNMRWKDARNYISEIGRLTRDGGRVFLTAFVEEGVPEETINPVDYVEYPCTVPLHVVRYQKDALFAAFEDHGLSVEEFSHHGGFHCNQSEIYLRKVGDS
jgi:SAM-dependent methyltransferase